VKTRVRGVSSEEERRQRERLDQHLRFERFVPVEKERE
jgi:hypothetical protein